MNYFRRQVRELALQMRFVPMLIPVFITSPSGKLLKCIRSQQKYIVIDQQLDKKFLETKISPFFSNFSFLPPPLSLLHASPSSPLSPSHSALALTPHLIFTSIPGNGETDLDYTAYRSPPKGNECVLIGARMVGQEKQQQCCYGIFRKCSHQLLIRLLSTGTYSWW